MLNICIFFITSFKKVFAKIRFIFFKMCFVCFDWAQKATGRGPQVGHASSESHEASWVPVGPLGLPPASFPANYCTGPSSPTRRLRSDDDTPHSLVLGITGKQQLGPAGCTSIPWG